MAKENLVTQRLSFLIGRKDEKETITQAIQGQRLAFLFLEGIPGIGKTVLLEEAERIAQEHGVLCPPIVDFYDTDMHVHRALEAAIARSLDPEGKTFQEYWSRRQQMDQAIVSEPKTLKEQQEELWRFFLRGYNRLAKERRVVLRFDTAERLEYGRDSEEVLEDCEVSPQDAPSWEWLLGRIGDLKNTVILIAARPTPTGLLRDQLFKTYERRVEYLKVEGFSLEETEAYFRATDFGKQVADEAPEMVGKVQLLTEGRPILIALALDWLERGIWEPRIYPASLEELKTWKGQAQEEERSGQRGEAWRRWDEIKRNFEMALVQQIRSLDHTGLDVAVKYAAMARKGCNAELLSRLMEVSLKEAERLVDQLLTLSFVKPPRDPRHLFFLHDEMYDLVEKYIWLVDWPDYSEQARLDGTIINWYTEQIESLREQIKATQDWKRRTALRRQQQLLITECLYYQFDEDPRLGYREYCYLDEEAIGSREHEWDTWLRNEALWFTSNRAWRQGKLIDTGAEGYPRRDPARIIKGKVERSPAVDYDCRRRWINRYTARNEIWKAARVAEKLLQKSKESPHPEEPELYSGSVQIALATAQAYMGGEFLEPALRNFQEGIQLLESAPEEHKEPWLYPYLLGTAYLYKGLALRNVLHLDEAARAYSRAAYHYRSISYQPGLAEAMNNLAYIYARQGRLEPARASCEEALHIRQELGDEYSVGLGLNTKGVIYERLDRPLTAIHNSEQALALFKEISNERGIILAEINLGRSYRRKARSTEWGQRDEDFEGGRRYLEDAIYRQAQLGASAEMFYRIEAHNELGCLYRDWVATLHEKGEKDSRLQAYLDKAEAYLRQAIDLATEEGKVLTRHTMQHIDSLEDSARVYYWRARSSPSVEEREKALNEMRRLLDSAGGLAREYLEGWNELRLVLGKVYFQRARLARMTAQRDLAAEYYAQAAGYVEAYSLDTPELSKFISETCTWICTHTPEEAANLVARMHATLKRSEQRSVRLQEWVNSVVYPSLGVLWPEEGQGVAHG